MSENQRRWLERGGLLAAFLLPLYFNPFVTQNPFESGKVLLFQGVTLFMVMVAFLPSLVRFSRRRQAAAGQSRQHDRMARWRRANPLFLPAIVYGLIYLSATAVSIDVKISLWGQGNRHGTITTLAAITFFLLLAAAWRQWQPVERMITAIIISSVPVAFYGCIQYFGWDTLAWVSDSISPVHSTLGRSLYLGAYLAMVIPFTLARIIGRRNDRRQRRPLAYSIILLLQISCLVFTLARGAWLGFLGSSLLFIGLLTYHKRNWFLGMIALVIAGLGSFVFITQAGGVIFLETAGVPASENLVKIREGSNRSRLITWSEALELVPQRWLLGYGPETYATAIEQRTDLSSSSEPGRLHLSDPHNLFLYQLTAVGVTGLLAFLGIIIRFYLFMLASFRRATSSSQKVVLATILSSITAYLIQAQFNPDVITLTVFFWINLSLGVAAANTATTDSRANTPTRNSRFFSIPTF